jgi:hypothetical protein
VITMLAGLALRAGIAPRFARPVVIGLLIALAIGALGVAKCTYDSGVIEDHENARVAREATAAVRATGAADAADANASAAAAERTETLKGAITHAVQQNPVATARPVGPATGNVLDELRRRRPTPERRQQRPGRVTL